MVRDGTDFCACTFFCLCMHCVIDLFWCLFYSYFMLSSLLSYESYVHKKFHVSENTGIYSAESKFKTESIGINLTLPSDASPYSKKDTFTISIVGMLFRSYNVPFKDFYALLGK